jgi:prepilin peptidase CpaA
MSPQHVVALAVAGLACVSDLRTRRVPNVLTFPAVLAALVFHLFVHGLPGLGWSAAGAFLGLLVFLPIFALGGLGAGDVKLAAALGAWVGVPDVFVVAVAGAIAGGVLAVAVGLATGYLRHALRNIWVLLMHWRVSGVRPLDSLTLSNAAGPRLPYAIPLTVGLLFTVWRQS